MKNGILVYCWLLFVILITNLTVSAGSYEESAIQEHSVDTIHTMVVLVDFSDAPAPEPVEKSIQYANDFFNTPGWTNGEDLINVWDYWWEISRNKTVVVNHIFGYFRAPETRAYYKEHDWKVSVAMMEQALNWARDNNPDFNWDQLTIGTNDRFLGLTCVFTEGIPGSGGTHWIGERFVAPNGVEGGQLVGSTLKLFTILHEYGHMLFKWPDTYNTKGGKGTGRYDLMSSNHYWIGIPNASSLINRGWLDVIDIDGPRTIVLEENGGTAVRYQKPGDPNELFVIEARNNTHRTTERIPGAPRGLYIWHIDRNVKGNGNFGIDISAGQHYAISLEQADGNFDLENGENYGDEGDAFSPGTSFTPFTVPDSNWWDGSASGLIIDNIEFLDNNRISFKVTLNSELTGN